MNAQQPTSKPFSIWTHVPMMACIGGLIGLNGAESWGTAITCIAIMGAGVLWAIVASMAPRTKRGRICFRLERKDVPPSKDYSPRWYMVIAVAFALGGLYMLLATVPMSGKESGLYGRWAFAVVLWTLAATSLLATVPMSGKESIGRTAHAILMGIGFGLAGVLMIVEGVQALQSGRELAELGFTKCALFASLLLIGGIAIIGSGVFRHWRRAKVYENGFMGPFGFVPWDEAESVELHEVDGQTVLDVGIVGGALQGKGWTVRFHVPEADRDVLASLLATRTGNDECPTTDE